MQHFISTHLSRFPSMTRTHNKACPTPFSTSQGVHERSICCPSGTVSFTADENEVEGFFFTTTWNLGPREGNRFKPVRAQNGENRVGRLVFVVDSKFAQTNEEVVNAFDNLETGYLPVW